MIYKKYVIQEGDTLQSISQVLTGDASNWYTIAQYNSLEYPYINRLNDLKYNVSGVAQPGDILTIPVSSSDTEIDEGKINKEQRNKITELILGRDLNIVSDTSDIESRGTTDETLSLTSTNNNISIVGGYENLRQALLMRLNTPKGTLILHPEYGNNFSDILGMPNTRDNVDKLKVMVEQTIRQDERVENVEVSLASVTEDVVTLELLIYPINFSEQLSLYLTTNDTSIELNY